MSIVSKDLLQNRPGGSRCGSSKQIRMASECGLDQGQGICTAYYCTVCTMSILLLSLHLQPINLDL